MRQRRGSDFRRMVRLFDGRRLQLAGLVASNLVGGVLEAGFLVVITRLAFAITDERHRVGLLAGVRTSLAWGLAIAAVMVAVRFVCAALAARQSAALTYSITLESRLALTKAYLGATWKMQHGDRVGRLQELLTTFTQRVSDLTQAIATWLGALLSLVTLLLTAVAVDPVASLAVIAAVAILGSVLRPIRRALRAQAKRTVASARMNGSCHPRSY